MTQCSYCKKNYEIPRGLTYVLTNGDIMYLCSSKCFKNWKMGRKSQKVNWIRKKDKNQSSVEIVKQTGKEKQI